MDNNWAFARIRKPVCFVEIDLNWVLGQDCNQQFTYLRRWAQEVTEAENSIDRLQNYAC